MFRFAKVESKFDVKPVYTCTSFKTLNKIVYAAWNMANTTTNNSQKRRPTHMKERETRDPSPYAK